MRDRLRLVADWLRERLPWRGRRDVDPANGHTIVAIVPAHNEGDAIADTLRGMLAQSRPLDRIVVAADNCTDDTVEVASQFRGVEVFETVDNSDRKVGALTQAWKRYCGDADYVLGVDADTRLDRDCVAQLAEEIEGNPQLGGLMARYTFDQSEARGPLSSFLVRLQRIEFAGWTQDLLRRDRRTYVLGGQATLFRNEALTQIAEETRRGSPWSVESQVEDMELTWRLDERGWDTKISPVARAYVGPMHGLRTLWAQRRKWDGGIAEMLLRNGFSSTTLYPWRVQAKMMLDLTIRVLFVTLFVLAQIRSSFVWNWLWAVPPVLAALLNLRLSLAMPHRKPFDVVFATIVIPVELYLWFRLAVWTTSWSQALLGIRRDGWQAQYRAEGKAA